LEREGERRGVEIAKKKELKRGDMKVFRQKNGEEKEIMDVICVFLIN
jgi:hypothetical protein